MTWMMELDDPRTMMSKCQCILRAIWINNLDIDLGSVNLTENSHIFYIFEIGYKESLKVDRIK